MTQDRAIIPSILVLDDEEEVARSLERLLRERLSVRVVVETDPASALSRIHFERFQVAIVDYMMPWMSGIEFLVRLKRLAPSTHRILVTGHVDTLTRLRDLAILEPVVLLMKPVATEPFVERVRALLASSKPSATRPRGDSTA